MGGWKRCGGVALAALFAPLAAYAAGAWTSGADDQGEPRVHARIVVDPDSRDGAGLRAGVQFRIDPGWHIYWRNPGDSGIATAVAWRGAQASELAWPAPSAFAEADGAIVTFGYAEQVVLASRLALAPRTQTLAADVELLACRHACIPATLTLSAPVAVQPAEEEELRALFAAHDAALPRSRSAFGASADVTSQGGDVALTLAPCDPGAACSRLALAPGVAFFPYEGSVRSSARALADGALEITLTETSDTRAPALRGVAVLQDALGTPTALAIDEPIAAGPAPASVTPLPAAVADASALGLLAALGLALVGGLVLNLMPCVLPVLAMKVFAVGALAGESRRAALRHGLAYGLGVELSMLALAAAALALRGAGHAVGWGFQFQEPAYVAGIAAVLVGFALNLFGVFEIGFQPSALADVGASAPGARRSFFEGLLAVALATPCSAPFLGTALGFAFASPAWTVAAVFLAIGAGLALPFVAISAFPRLARFMPRSGKWMGALRSVLGFALLGTVVWLLWIVGRSAGADAVVALLALLLVGALVAWVYGRAQELRFASVAAAIAVAGLVAGGANWIRLDGASAMPRAAASSQPSAIAWSRTAVASALERGQPAFVYFSADWCLTCKMNERVAIDTDATRARLRALGFAVLHGDWTQRGDEIRAELARHGKAGVPLYLVYSPSAPDRPLVLPELISEDSLARALDEAAPAGLETREEVTKS